MERVEMDMGLDETMNKLARLLDAYFNGERRSTEQDIGFILMVFPFGEGGQVNYISNAKHEDVVMMLKQQLAHFEGQPEVEGHA